MMWLFDCISEVGLPSDFEIVKRRAPSSPHLACGLNGSFFPQPRDPLSAATAGLCDTE